MLQGNRFTRSIGALFALGAVLITGCSGVSLDLGPLGFRSSVSPTGTLLYADSGVIVIRDQVAVHLVPGMEMKSGDIIETTDGQAVLDYDNGNVVMLNSRTRIQLGSIKLFFGELFAKIKSITRQGGGQVVTDELTASVEGTEYGIGRDLPTAGGTAANVQVYVRAGHVLCSPGPTASWSPLSITVNQMYEITGHRRASAVRSVDALSLSRWADVAERRLKKKRTTANQTRLRPLRLWTPRPRERDPNSSDYPE